MTINIAILLKLMAIYLWSYILGLFLYIPSLANSRLGNIFVRSEQIAAFEFELLFALLFAVWGVFLWICSRKPKENALFIDFTLWATIIHVAWMIVIAITNPSDAMHMIRDAIIPTALVILIMYSKVKSPQNI